MKNFSKQERAIIKKLNTPAKIQDYLNALKFNFEPNGDTIKSPLWTLRSHNAHCFEGALLGGFLLHYHKYDAYLLHLKSTSDDYDHVVAVFKTHGYYGALSKTNHGVLRYREPAYKTLRELTMSYFHEYFLNSTGEKTLREYSELLPIQKLPKGWENSEDDLWVVDKMLDKIKHYKILPTNLIRSLRKADKIEIEMGKIKQYKK